MARVKTKGKQKYGPKGINQRSKDIKKKILNPFEVHVNRQKHDVLGRKVKNDRGLPGVSRAKALKKRKATLLQEYKVHDKSNKFMDRRIGEKNRAMTGEDRIMARFTAERMKIHNKKAMFNLADDEVLTHHGQTLTEIEKFDDPRSEDEDEIDEGKLDAKFVKEAHFGGGILTKSNSNPQSRKELIEQLIAESKQRKAEQKKSREHAQELTDKLDTEWKDLLPIIATSKKKPGQDNMDVDKPDDYDITMRELRFEARGKPTDRLKSEEEIASAEKERLETLEADRIKRMHGITESNKPTKTHRSADDLDDGFAFNSDDEAGIVSYDADGILENHNTYQCDDSEGMETDVEHKKSQLNNDGSSEDDNDDLEDDIDDDDENSEDDLEDLKSDSEVDELSPVNVEELVKSKIQSDSLNKLKSRQEGQHSTQEEKVSLRSSGIQETCFRPASNLAINETSSSVSPINKEEDQMEAVKDNSGEKDNRDPYHERIKQDLLARKIMMDTARKELPYTYKVPENYEELQELLVDQSPEYQCVILERIIKCTHPSLADGNKDKLATLLAFLLQHLHDTASKENGADCFVVLDRLAPHFYDLAIIAPGNARRCIAEVIKEKQNDYRNQRRTFPTQETLLFFKLVSLLFPTSDYRHPVVTPAFVFMGQMLEKCVVRTRRDIASGLYICTLLLEFTVLSKRFCPAAIGFLLRLLQSAMPESKTSEQLLKMSSNFIQSPTVGLMSLRELSNDQKIDDTFRHQAISQAVKLLEEFSSNLNELPAPYQIFQPVMQLKPNHLPTSLHTQVLSLQSLVETMGLKHMPKMVPEAKKPKVLRLYEPSFGTVYDGKKYRVMGRERQEREKLIHKVKRETKGAMREIRRDRTFIAKLKIKETIKSDIERRSKVKEIFGTAASQQGELNAIARKKKK